ncbi:uncharacterized protein LY79DRAFT_681685 [Colletotrichum navitas]|uniref:Uncharacterized protein n=1 Tax=Colletotrichum navitas TaxID=681940 RepID=A0AAD8Q537_9PEZI|nr:uncharacterized protein LY79DRAFT_681685 [Colletotrichum navitas]KAK1595347.1 hypothetical protein LY79DRAFT_681685 [Colletotrichum navitas]
MSSVSLQTVQIIQQPSQLLSHPYHTVKPTNPTPSPAHRQSEAPPPSSTEKMDPFKKLPAELCVKIMLSTCSQSTVFQLIQASPVMLRQYTASKRYIIKRLLASDFDKSMVQDAMAIILFPSEDISHFEALARAHHRSWATKQFADPLHQPLQSQDQDFIDMIIKLYRGLMFFIEDYLTKATAAFPPREYLCVPSGTQLLFKGQAVCPKFNAANLTNPERKRLLRAFLWCQLHSLFARMESSQNEGFCNMRLLHQEPQPWDTEAIRCVHTYLMSLYGAIIAQCSSDVWLPEVVPRATSPHPPGLLYPDSLYVDADVYASTLTHRCDTSALAAAGFDLAALLLRSATAGQLGRDRLGKWFTAAYPNCNWGEFHPVSFHWCDFHSFIRGYIDFGANKEDHQNAPGMYEILRPQLCTLPIQRKIYQQRAWVFFDDARFYPSPSPDIMPHFPTEDDIMNEQFYNTKQDKDWFTYPQETQAQHRSQKWHNKQRGISTDTTKAENMQDLELAKEYEVSLPSIMSIAFHHRLLLSDLTYIQEAEKTKET